jgi:peptidoglycan LD-endopeptidase CwlK
VSAGITMARPSHHPGLLAPRFHDAVLASIAECHNHGLDAFLYEAYRSPELQALYYERGRTIIPPTKPATNARSNLYSWHGYGLAVDVISTAKAWDVPDTWFAEVAEVFKRHGLKWGGDWKMRDLPHFQWGPCKPSPSDRAREIIITGGVHGVWVAVGAS